MVNIQKNENQLQLSFCIHKYRNISSTS